MAVIDVGATLADPSNPLIIDSLYATFRLQAWAGTIKACAVCWDALVPKERGGGVTDASRLAWNTAMVIRRSFSAPMSASVPATCISTIRSPPWGGATSLGRCFSPDGRSSRDCLRGDAGRCTWFGGWIAAAAR